ncbi:3'-5' exonuclease [Aliagarivorans marinus]|uniref:3'-5' exonuclease n=1 Tax=Aliagarivorans marinus TaxID=561965 RepID=UPI0003FEB1D0|nr:3'-5' exonuclease [Aliagarivorans marinus]
MTAANSLIVLDFETTGLSPDQGDRAIEIAAVKLQRGQVVDEFQALMNPGRRVNSFIESYTGISNEMLSSAAPCEQVMGEFYQFIGDTPLLAHNASFDMKFLNGEFARIGLSCNSPALCSLLTARRLLPDAPNHKLGTLVDYLGIDHDGQYHRALFDAQMTAQVWLAMLEQIEQAYPDVTPSIELMMALAKRPKKQVPAWLDKQSVVRV